MSAALLCPSLVTHLSPLPPSPHPRPPQLATHGPGLFLSKHLPDQPEEEDQALQSTRKSRCRGGKGGGGRRGAEDESPVLGDLDWDLAEEPSLLVWDGERVGGVEVLQPSPETRPIRLVVSKLLRGLFGVDGRFGFEGALGSVWKVLCLELLSDAAQDYCAFF